MKLLLRVNPDISETEVEIRCRERDSEIDNLIDAIHSSAEAIFGINDTGDTERIYTSQILYIEAVDRDVFAYKAEGVYKIRKTLYELEENLKNKLFVRISKSVIVNLKAVRSVSPEDFRRCRLLLKNGEYLIVSRNYVNNFKAAIGMKGGSGK
jgi:DNA-binding LytR/AlgR family response regulator